MEVSDAIKNCTKTKKVNGKYYFKILKSIKLIGILFKMFIKIGKIY